MIIPNCESNFDICKKKLQFSNVLKNNHKENNFLSSRYMEFFFLILLYHIVRRHCQQSSRDVENVHLPIYLLPSGDS